MDAVYPLQLFPIEIWCRIGFSDYDLYDNLKKTCACFWKFCKANKHLIQKSFEKVTVKENKIIWAANDKPNRFNWLVPVIHSDYIQWRTNRKNDKAFSVWVTGEVEIRIILSDEHPIIHSIDQKGGVWYMSYNLSCYKLSFLIFEHLIFHWHDHLRTIMRRSMGNTYYVIVIHMDDTTHWRAPNPNKQINKKIRKEKPAAIENKGSLNYLPNSYRKNLPTCLCWNGEFR